MKWVFTTTRDGKELFMRIHVVPEGRVFITRYSKSQEQEAKKNLIQRVQEEDPSAEISYE